MKRLIFFVLIGLLLVSSAAAECLLIDADTLVSEASLSSRMQGIRIQKTVEPPAFVRLTIAQTDPVAVIFDKTYGERSGRFDSGDIYLPYTGKSATEYSVTLQVGDAALSFSYTSFQPRLEDNSAYTFGPRIGTDWPMATIVDLSQAKTTVPICASNLYIIGQATFTVNGGMLTVSTSFAPSANAAVHYQAVYLTGNPTSLHDNPLKQAAYAIGEAIDITGSQTALVYVPIKLSYDPFGLSSFVYDISDSQMQSQLSLLSR